MTKSPIKRICILTIAGSDSGAGAGVQADARTIHDLGGYALTAITAVTAQNTRGVKTWRPVPAELIASQIEAVLGDFPVKAIKTGLLPGAEAARVVAQTLKRHPKIPLIVDPILGSSSGTRFLSASGLRVLKTELLPRAALITPNWPETEALTGIKVRDWQDVERAAQALIAVGCRAALIKGGHAPGARCRDFLATAEGSSRWFESPRIATRNTHGTGCVLSAAIAAYLARGRSLEASVAGGRRFLLRALAAGQSVRWGGRGPALGRSSV